MFNNQAYLETLFFMATIYHVTFILNVICVLTLLNGMTYLLKWLTPNLFDTAHESWLAFFITLYFVNQYLPTFSLLKLYFYKHCRS